MINNKFTKSIVLSILSIVITLACLSVSIYAWFTSNEAVSSNEIEFRVMSSDKADVQLYQFNKESKVFDEITRISLTMIPTERQYYKIELSNFNEIYSSATFNIVEESSSYPSTSSIDTKYVDDLGNPVYPIENVIILYAATFDEETIAFSLTKFDDSALESYTKSNSIIEIYFAIEFDGSEESFVTIDGILDYSNPYQNQIYEINKLFINLDE